MTDQERPDPRLMDIRKLSAYLDVPAATLYSWRSTHRIPARCIVRLGRKLLFDRARVDEWVESGLASERS